MAICAMPVTWSCSGSHPAEVRKITASKPLPAHNASIKQKARRAQYRYSVIAGGAYSSDELARARRTDGVVREHYREFSDHPAFKRIDNDLLVYVSYRKQDHVYWTRTKHRVRRGETVLVDGVHLARARCGNQLAFRPQTPVDSGGEPAEDILNAPETPQIEAFSTVQRPELPEADLYVPSLELPGGGPDLSFPMPGLAQPIAAAPATSFGPLGGGSLPPGLGFQNRLQSANPNSPAAAGLLPADSLPESAANAANGGTPNVVSPPIVGMPVPSVNPPISAVPEPNLSRMMWPLMMAGLIFLAFRKSAKTM